MQICKRCARPHRGKCDDGHHPVPVILGPTCFIPAPPRYPRWRRVRNSLADAFAGLSALDVIKLTGRTLASEKHVLGAAGWLFIMLAVTIIVRGWDWATGRILSGLPWRISWGICLVLAALAIAAGYWVWLRRDRIERGTHERKQL